MLFSIVKLFVAAGVISFSAWLAGKKPALAGFIIALPLSSLIALVFTQVEFQDPTKSVQFAKSIFVSVPLSLMFFLPFLFADWLKFSFWQLYLCGVGCLTLGYGIHRVIFQE